METPLTGLIFDLDGTLIDSVTEIHGCAAAMMQTEGLPEPSLTQVRGFIGRGVGPLISQCLAANGQHETSERTSRMSQNFHSVYDTAVDRTTLYPNVEEILRKLHSKGFSLGLCTNKPEVPTYSVLDYFDLRHLFDGFSFGDGPYPRKPDPAPVRLVMKQLDCRQFLYIGDRETDAETAKNAELPMLLFTQGYRKTPLEQLAHAEHFDDFADLPGIVDRLTN